MRDLKGSSEDDLRGYEKFLRSTAAQLYGSGVARRDACPCCAAPSEGAVEALCVFDVPYVRCTACTHVFVRDQPSPAAFTRIFAESEEHSAPYTDQETLRVRMEQVVRPKVRWVLDTWAAAHMAPPRSVVDVGAGGGHMLAGFRDAGLEVRGHELSAASRRFASMTFGLDLLDDDFLNASDQSADIVTMWGLLEYTPEPGAFVAAARRTLDNGGLLVAEVPRFDCVGTAAQSVAGAVVTRHLDPTSHVNCFTDESLATVLLDNGFAPVAAWYFGMDAYEVLVQTALRVGGDAVLDQVAEPILALQPAFDAALACDDLVVAAVPIN